VNLLTNPLLAHPEHNRNTTPVMREPDCREQARGYRSPIAKLDELINALKRW